MSITRKQKATKRAQDRRGSASSKRKTPSGEQESLRAAAHLNDQNGSSIYSIGHSTRTATELIELLSAHRVDIVADIRTIPRSRRNPQFNQKELAKALKRARIEYIHLPRLGGLRKSIGRLSPNQGWRNASFRGYADYMQTDEFEIGLEELLTLATRAHVAMMCAEAVPWRCHRSLVSDALLARGISVKHITGRGEPSLHEMTSFASVRAGKVIYPGPNRPRGS